MKESYLAKEVLNDRFSNNDGSGLPWKVSYKIIKICQINQINKDTEWKNIIPLIQKWDSNDIKNRIKEKVPHSLKWLPTTFVENGTQSYIDGTLESKIISEFRLGRGQLKNRDESGIIKCTLCQSNAQMTEAHVILS